MNYLVHSTLIFTIFYVFFKLFLAKETFYQLNRAILLGIIFISLMLPILVIPETWALNTGTIISNEIISFEISTHSFAENNKTLIDYLPIIYWAGFSVFTLSLLIQFFSLILMKNSLNNYRSGKYLIVELQDEKPPFSFFNWIFIHQESYDTSTYSQIIAHEKIHIDQAHFIDKLIAELAVIIFWFNPYIRLLRNSINQNLEYIVDRELLKNGTNAQSYQLSLLQVTVNEYSLDLANSYNQSGLHKRIIMMNRKRSSLKFIWKYIALIPVLLVCIVSINTTFAHEIEHSYTGQYNEPRVDDIYGFREELINKLRTDKLITTNNTSFTLTMKGNRLSFKTKGKTIDLPTSYNLLLKTYGVKHSNGKMIQNKTQGSNFGIGYRNNDEYIGQWIL